LKRTHARLLIAILLTLLTSYIALSQRGGGGGGAAGGGARGAPAPAPQRGQQPPRAGGPRAGGVRGAPGQRGERGQRRGQEELTPDGGLVTAYVTVTTRDHKPLSGLGRANFHVLEDDVEQQLEAFSVESGPLSVGFIVGGDPSEFRGIAPAFLKATAWDDEYFVLVDTGRPPGGTVIQNFTTDVLKVPKVFQTGGVTADSVYVGLDYLKEAGNRRKLLLLFGGSLSTDDASRTGLDPNYVIRTATRQGVQVYSVLTSNDTGAFDDAGTSDIAPLTGGRAFISATSSGSLEAFAEEIASGIGVQYLIGYHTTNPEKDGKWRRIKVEVVDPPAEAGKLTVWTRSGYYADKEKKK